MLNKWQNISSVDSDWPTHQSSLVMATKIMEPYKPAHDKTNKMACAPSKDSDQPGHPPSLIRVFAVRSMGS